MATVELESHVARHNVVESVTLRVYGGQDHREQETAAGRYLDAMQEFTSPIVCNVYERTPKTDSKGDAYVEFRYFTFNSPNN